jgi:predicted 3-demethylubiquinone-9 3-methyltransferase (glyoxalase superfamily)
MSLHHRPVDSIEEQQREARRAFAAVMKMRKIDVAVIDTARRG